MLSNTSDSDSDGSKPNQNPNPGSDLGTREGGGRGPKGIYICIYECKCDDN